MFHNYTLKQVYEFAEKMGYNPKEVKIERVCVEYDYDLEKEIDFEYQVSFGNAYTESWFWAFDNLADPATYYEHSIWED